MRANAARMRTNRESNMNFRTLQRVALSGVATIIGLTAALGPLPADAAGPLRIAMTAADVPMTTGAPDNGYEGMRFLGFPVFEGLTLWDLGSADKPATLRPGLAERWEQDKADSKKWIFHLRRNVAFHDGSQFNADAVIWNLDRTFKQDSPQFDPKGAAFNRPRLAFLASYRKIDDFTVELITTRPISYFPIQLAYTQFASPAQFAKTGSSWQEFAKDPSGTGPFKITEFKPRISVTLSRNERYWDQAKVPKLDKIVLLPIPEPTTRLAALRSGQVDWIEAPPPDAVPSLKSAGYNIVTNSYPHGWFWLLSMNKPNSPWGDVRVRRAINYCVDRQGLVTLLNGLAEPSVGLFKANDPRFGSPNERYKYDPAKAKALMKEAGFGPDKPLKAKVLMSSSGSGQMMPLPMNEFLQQNLKDCGFDVAFDVVEWGALLVANRSEPQSAPVRGADVLNISLPAAQDIAQMGYFTRPSNAPPKGVNWAGWQSDEYNALFDQIENLTDPKETLELTAKAHALLVDTAPWVFIVHDLNARAMSKKVSGFVSAQSWFQDFTTIEMK